jgi:hypothetical protein
MRPARPIMSDACTARYGSGWRARPFLMFSFLVGTLFLAPIGCKREPPAVAAIPPLGLANEEGYPQWRCSASRPKC